MLHKRVTTETRSNSETKIWHLRNSTLLKAKYQYLMRLVSTSEVSIGSFVCGCQKKTSTDVKAFVHAVKLLQLKGKAAYLEIYANLQKGKTYFSITTKEGVEKYLSFRQRDVELGHIVKGRHTTIATHLQHFLSYIGKDTKLKELERTVCENYFYYRHKATNGNVKQVKVQNEQSTINALMKWLHKNGETHRWL